MNAHIRHIHGTALISLLILFAFSSLVRAQVTLPNVFSDHMVLQRNLENPIWGKASKGEKITVTIGDQTQRTISDKDGFWRVKLNPMTAGGPYILTVKGSNGEVRITDILIGEVWICSGQSNMEFALENIYNAEVEQAAANFPEIRLLSIPKTGRPELQDDVPATWTICSPESTGAFSAVGYLFGKNIHNTLGVPVGLINASWGGSPIEAFIPRNVQENCGECLPYLEKWDKKMTNYTDETFKQEQKEYQEWLAADKPGAKKWPPADQRIANKRPANIYNGMIHPLKGYGIKGVIWYQGEANIYDPDKYKISFPLMINTWRNLWQQGDFPFYWVQLADFELEQTLPNDSRWAELREAQTSTLSLPNTGQAVIIDLGEQRDIHPREKNTAASRLTRHALANAYGFELQAKSPQYVSMKKEGNAIILTFDNIDKGLYAFDVEEVKGFAIAGADKKYYWAEAKIIGKNQIEVMADKVKDPVAVRYGWADNPIVNLYDENGLPVTPFRTDDWSK